jgi:type IV pilus assembly protein PilM
MIFGDDKDNFVGIDIGESSIKLVEIEKTGEILKLNTYAELMLGPYIGLGEGEVVKLGENTMSEALKDLYKESRATSTKINMSIPMSACTIMQVSIPKEAEALVDKVLPIEMQKYLPFSINDILMSYQKVDTSQTSSRTSYLVTCVNKKIFNSLKNIAVNAGLQNVNFEPSIFGDIRILPIEANQVSIIVNIGSNMTSVAFLSGNSLMETSTFNVGSNHITFSLKETFGLDFEKAEKIKKVFGMNGDSSNPLLKDVIDLSTRKIVNEVLHIRNRCESRYNVKCTNIWLTGGGAQMVGVEKFFIDETGIETKISRVMQRIKLPEVSRESIEKESPNYTSALGLALSFL